MREVDDDSEPIASLPETAFLRIRPTAVGRDAPLIDRGSDGPAWCSEIRLASCTRPGGLCELRFMIQTERGRVATEAGGGCETPILSRTGEERMYLPLTCLVRHLYMHQLLVAGEIASSKLLSCHRVCLLRLAFVCRDPLAQRHAKHSRG